ncbi:hypothetical protein O4H49_12985 [Kiloniella laminariae]|uniref:Glycine-rich domain-containing protein n=1 Tax=Kiloniella laminariae TaxID=454162 RepID=A0ABT4LKR3_9PROT|nr:hypothetical protein [Kiloniella laminariae]MCZ4281698.1 hypothetical protein [Kiloniella laminariae]
MTLMAPQPVSLSAFSPPPGDLFLTTPGQTDWVVPQGVYSVRVTLIGGGGGAGAHGSYTTGNASTNYNISSSGGGGGGGGGGAFVKKVLPVFPGQIIPVVVGAGGASINYVHLIWGKNIDGNDGIDSSFGNLLTADSGKGGGGGWAQYQSTGVGGIAGAGGIAAGGDINLNGAAGEAGDHRNVVGLSFIHADGGTGGEGQVLDSVPYGAGGTGHPKEISDPAQAPGTDGCCLIEWGF